MFDNVELPVSISDCTLCGTLRENHKMRRKSDTSSTLSFRAKKVLEGMDKLLVLR